MNTSFKKNIPNLITLFRIASSIVLFAFECDSAVFLVLYGIAGISDVVDGFLARKLKCVSVLGSRLDSIADLIFYAVMLYKVFPTVLTIIPMYFVYWAAGIIAVRMLSYAIAAIKFKQFAAMHTYLNKATGLAVFIVPFMIPIPQFKIYCYILCSIASISSIEELLIHCISKQYKPNMRNVLYFKNKAKNTDSSNK